MLTGGWCARPGFYIPKVVLARWFEPTRMCWNALPIKRRTQAVSPCESWVQTCCVPSGPVATPTVATHLEVRGPSHGQRPQKPQQAQMPQRLWLGAAHRVPGRTTADGSEPDPGFGNGFNGKAPHTGHAVCGEEEAGAASGARQQWPMWTLLGLEPPWTPGSTLTPGAAGAQPCSPAQEAAAHVTPECRCGSRRGHCSRDSCSSLAACRGIGSYLAGMPTATSVIAQPVARHPSTPWPDKGDCCLEARAPCWS